MLKELVFSVDKKEIAFLIDPDKFLAASIPKLKCRVDEFNPHYFFVGGSFLSKGNLDQTIELLKENFSLPVIIFPGEQTQISSKADASWFLTFNSPGGANSPNIWAGTSKFKRPVPFHPTNPGVFH